MMEYVALLNGEAWTDAPTCTDPVIAEDRPRLVPLIGRLFGTGGNDRHVSAALAEWTLRFHGLTNKRYEGVPELADIYDRASRCRRPIKLLTGLLDEYDRLTGRSEHRDVTPEELALLAERVEAGAR